MTSNRKYHIGIIGTGFIARGLMYSLIGKPQFEVSGVLTRRAIKTINDLPVKKKKITNSIEKVIRVSDLVVECSGDVIHGTEMVERVLKAGVPVVTMNPELQVTTGSYLCQMGTFVEAEGDQPGVLAALDAEVKAMGFTPIVYGNIKGFLNHKPTRKEMKYWAGRQGISVTQTTNFTDGTKLQIEQALVANGLSATITRQGLSGIKCETYEDGASRLAEEADKLGKPISDYVLSGGSPPGVFIVAKLDKTQGEYIKHLKMGEGPNYTFLRPFHLCHLEISKTIANVLTGNTSYSFNNSPYPSVQVMAIAKRKIKKGEKLKRGIGSFVVRGETAKISESPNGVPIGLMHEVKFVKDVRDGKMITFADIKLPKTRALEMWRKILNKVNPEAEDGIKPQLKRRPRRPKSLPYTKWLPSIRPFAGLNLTTLFRK